MKDEKSARRDFVKGVLASGAAIAVGTAAAKAEAVSKHLASDKPDKGEGRQPWVHELTAEAKIPNTSRAIKLSEGDTLEDIIEESTVKDKKPKSLLVWREDGGWDLYCLPGVRVERVPGNKPFPPMQSDQVPDLSKAQVDTVTAIRMNPTCIKIGGSWYWF